MALPPWDQVNTLTDGEHVNANTTNRAITQLVRRTDYLKEVLESIDSSEALYHRDAPIRSGIAPGTIVYWDADAQQYSEALAAVTSELSGGIMVVANSSYVAGMVMDIAGTRGTVLINGILENFDFTSVVDSAYIVGGQIIPGQYFLSSGTAGQLTRQRPPVGVYVATIYNNTTARVNPLPKDILDSHIHYKFSLSTEPIGEINCAEVGDRVTITPAEDLEGQRGWLPADHEVFGGAAPAGAAYGYYLDGHPELYQAFPPVPLTSVYLEQNGIAVELGEPDGRAIIDLNGIWWMDDCYGYTPWHPEFECEEEPTPTPSATPSPSASGEEPCPDPMFWFLPGHGSGPDSMNLNLWFTKMVFKTGDSIVTSLSSPEGSPIIITNLNGGPASVGNLLVDFDLESTSIEDAAGSIVVKGFDGWNVIKGPVVERIVAGGNIDITSEQGTVEINAFDPTSAQRQGGVELVGLSNVREQNYQGVYYLGFPSGMASSIRGKIALPPSGLPSSPIMRINFQILGRVAGTLPALTFTYRRVPAAALNTAAALPTADTTGTSVNLATAGAIAANTYFGAQSMIIPGVQNGDIIFFSLGRSSTGGYSGEVGLLRVNYTIQAGV